MRAKHSRVVGAVTLTLAEANSIVDVVAIAKAREFNITVSVAVRAPGSQVPRLKASSTIRRPPTSLRRVCRQSESEADCRFSEMAKSRARAESAERHPTNKRRSVLALGLPASNSKKAG